LPAPSPAEQVDFLNKLQRLLSEGLFTATYKHAFLSALADLSIEQGDDSGEAMQLSPFAIAEKLFESGSNLAKIGRRHWTWSFL
jgi:hypothetical protein